MTLVLRGAGAIVSIGEGDNQKTYNFGRGAIPDDTPEAVIDILRRRGALQGTVPTALGLDATSADNQVKIAAGDLTGSGQNPPGPTIDVRTASVEEIARHIDQANDGKGLNATDTVALAGDDPALAGKVLEAEVTASGGDGRTTVVEPLTRLRDRDE
jgi:hypothetical protein